MNESEIQKWEETLSSAKKTVDNLISRLPDALRLEAIRIGYKLRRRCLDGENPYGTFEERAAVITLYLETIRDDWTAEYLEFERRIEKIYLHELGHHLGLDEPDLEKRGL